MANKVKYKEIQLEIQTLSHALRESTKNLCRNLKDNPNIGENLLKIQREREHLQDLLAKTVQELRTGTFDTLVTQVISVGHGHAPLPGVLAVTQVRRLCGVTAGARGEGTAGETVRDCTQGTRDQRSCEAAYRRWVVVLPRGGECLRH